MTTIPATPSPVYNDPPPCRDCDPVYQDWLTHAALFPTDSYRHHNARSHAAHVRSLCRTYHHKLPYRRL